MVHENAGRAHEPGQPQVPERDIEPLWPPEQLDPAATTPPWAAPVDLDLPFSLDPPASAPMPRTPAMGPRPTQAPAPVPAPAPRDAVPQEGPASRADAVGRGPAPDHGGAVPTTGADGSTAGEASDDVGQADDGPGPGRTASPWSQPPQRPNNGTPEIDAPALAGPSAGAPTPPDGTAGPPAGPPEVAPPRLGPFPPAPGVPRQPYPNGQPGYPGESAYPPPEAAGTPSGWYPPVPPQPGPPLPGAPQPVAPGPPPAGHPEPGWAPETGATPTAEDFARRRQARPADPVATMGVRGVVNRMGLVRLQPGRHEQELRRDIEMVRRNFGGLRQVTVVNPKGGAGKTVAILLLAMTFGQKRGGYVLAWDNNETQGTLGMRAQQDFHSRTVRDMLRDLAQFQGPHGRVGDLSQYVRSQGEGMFDVLASDESATGGEMLTAAAFAEIREVVSRFYKLIFVDTGNNVRAQNWQAAMDATDQLVVTMSARNDSAETAARMLDHLEQSGRHRLVRQAVTVVSMPPSRKEIDLPAIQEHFAARTRAVLLAPYERLIDTGEPIRYGQLSSATRDAWLKIAAAVAEGL
ncbi:chromosome partitioning protein [Micromonospora sp. NPDC003776]